MTRTTQQLLGGGGLEACSSRKYFRIRRSDIASEVFYGPKYPNQNIFTALVLIPLQSSWC